MNGSLGQDLSNKWKVHFYILFVNRLLKLIGEFDSLTPFGFISLKTNESGSPHCLIERLNNQQYSSQKGKNKPSRFVEMIWLLSTLLVLGKVCENFKSNQRQRLVKNFPHFFRNYYIF